MNNLNYNYITDYKQKSGKKLNLFKNIDNFKEYLLSKCNEFTKKKEILSSERKRNTLTVLVKLKNVRVKFPFNPLKLDAPIFKVNFNLIYNQNSTYVYTDFFLLPSKTVVGTFYEYNTSSMNTSVSNFDLDMVYFLPHRKAFTRNLPEERLLSNFRMACLIESFIVLNSEQNVMIIDVIIEPIMFSFGMRQFRKSWSMYEKSMNYLSLMWEKYIPYVNPGDTLKHNKRKSLKDLIYKVINRQNLKRDLERKLNLSKKKKLINKIINTEHFNSLLITNVKSDKIGFIFFDNTHIGEKNILLDVRIKKLICKYLQNSKIKDKENVSYALYEMITGDNIPKNKYNRNTLSMYYYVFCSTNANYYNLVTNKFEPIIERFETSVEMMQVAPFFKAKTYVIINDIINFNLSADSIIAFNSFMLRYSQNEELWDTPKELINPLKWRSTVQLTFHDLNEMNRKDETVLQFLNYTGINIIFFFDSFITNQIQIKPREIVSFTSHTLDRARGLHKKKARVERTTFSVIIKDSFPIENINYKRTNYQQYKLYVEIYPNKYIPIYFNITVKSTYTYNKVCFSSSFSFLNNTEYYKIIILIKNETIEENSLTILKGTKKYMPLTWLICEKPYSSIFMKINDNKELIKICDHICDLIIEPLDENQLKENENIKKKIEKNFPDVNPKLKKILEIKKMEVDNIKKSQVVSINNKGKNSYINLDLFMQQSKKLDFKTEENKEYNKNIKSNYDKTVDVLNNSIIALNIESKIPRPENNYEYIISIRPPLVISNKLPFTLTLSYKDIELVVDTLQEKDFYEISAISVDDEISIKIQYYERDYVSKPFKINDFEIEKYLDLINESTQICLKCHILKKPLENKIKKPRNYFLETKIYSINTYEIIFFFDYIINNRLTNILWICPCKGKMKKLTEEQIDSKKYEIKPTSLTLLSFPDYEPSFSIKDEYSNWSDPFNLNTIGIEGFIQLDNISNNNESLKSVNEIGVILTKSSLYKFSVIIIFEPKYVLINNLGFDITYKQENNSLNKEILLKNNEFCSLKYEEIDKFFKIGIYDEISHMTNYSGLFNIEINEDLDLKVRINPNSCIVNKDTKIFSYDGYEYYILIRLINKTYDKGTVYILFCNPLFPYLEIVNNLKVPLTIYESSSNKPLVINNPKVTNFPFAWENPAKHKDELEFEVYGYKEDFSFNIFNERNIRIREQNLSLTYSISSKNKTETRSFKIEKSKVIDQGELELSRFFIKKKKLTSSIYDCFIKGVGISLINQELKEIFYISFYNIKAQYITNILKSNSDTRIITRVKYIAYIDNFQVDYCLNDSLRTIISPMLQIVPSNEQKIIKNLEKRKIPLIPFMAANVTTKTIKNLISNEEFTSYEIIQVVLQKFEMKVEQNELINLLKMYNDFMKLFDYYTISNEVNGQEKDKEPLLDVELPIPRKKLMKENENSIRQLINYLALSSLKLELTIRLDTKPIDLHIPILVDRILGSIFHVLGRISNCPLSFNEQVIKNIYMSWYDLTWKIINPYITQGIVQIYKILGSLDIIGNPVNLINNITEGVYDFVKEPGQELKNNKIGFELGGGIARGIGGLVSGVVGGAFDSLQRITTTLLVTIQAIQGREKQFILYEEQNEPSNALSGIYQGIYGFGSEIGNGAYNLFVQPCVNFNRKGVAGFCGGLCKGLIGFVLCPVTAVLKLVSSFASGIKNSCFGLTGRKKLKTERFRYPRIIVEGEETIHSYNENKAEAKELLFKLNKENTDNILYTEDFICADQGFGRKFSTAILTDKAIYVVYNTKKIIYEELIENIKLSNVHFIDDKFIIAFKLNNGHSRGFSINKDYSKVATELNNLIVPVLTRVQTMNLLYKNTNFIERGIIGQKGHDEEDIDISSYNRTMTENTYNSMKTLSSKITEKF